MCYPATGMTRGTAPASNPWCPAPHTHPCEEQCQAEALGLHCPGGWRPGLPSTIWRVSCAFHGLCHHVTPSWQCLDGVACITARGSRAHSPAPPLLRSRPSITLWYDVGSHAGRSSAQSAVSMWCQQSSVAGNVGVKLTYCQAWALGRRAQELQLVGLAVLLPVGSS